ncbi:MFS general substrate transporter [Gonapodya prolifera JEL478]|uniref:MFS general substrate transporter n=1 Tax=Gonapodya prolifera (strain JEL478) TaxID=1344416 RepID=A0A139AXX3_GONPJ|nr:MFS general substrate transporter [Gonapodya prolifera JEL478]|eukprot:KXS21557.1 MFS general substrate transporter [Gonapodya prolifera JEL478]
MASDEKKSSPVPLAEPRVFYRSTWFAATVLGLCNFSAPGIWVAMNSLGAGGQATPFLVNTSNALTFVLMVVTAFLTSALVKVIGVKWTLAFGAAGYAPYAAGLYTNNLYGNEWFLLLGAALCGISAGTFWAIEAAIALTYPEPENQGRFLGWWLTFRVAGQVLGGAINLGLNADRNEAGKVNPTVYLIFIALQCLGPFVAILLPSPERVQRTDGLPVKLFNDTSILNELKATARLFVSPKFLLVVPLIAQAVFPEAFFNTYLTLHFSVRARALGSFISAILALTVGNVLGWGLDRTGVSLKNRTRRAVISVLAIQGALWIWSTVIQQEYQAAGTNLDWSDAGFLRGFLLYVFLVAIFQAQYLLLYHVVGNVVENNEDTVRAAGLLRATESAAQAVSYGLNGVESFGTIGASALNFSLWGFALIPTYIVVWRIGVAYYGRAEREALEGKNVSQSDEKSEESSGFIQEKV